MDPTILRIIAGLLGALGAALVVVPRALQCGWLRQARWQYGLSYDDPNRALPPRRLRVYGVVTLFGAAICYAVSLLL